MLEKNKVITAARNGYRGISINILPIVVDRREMNEWKVISC